MPGIELGEKEIAGIHHPLDVVSGPTASIAAQHGPVHLRLFEPKNRIRLLDEYRKRPGKLFGPGIHIFANHFVVLGSQHPSRLASGLVLVVSEVALLRGFRSLPADKPRQVDVEEKRSVPEPMAHRLREPLEHRLSGSSELLHGGFRTGGERVLQHRLLAGGTAKRLPQGYIRAHALVRLHHVSGSG